MTESTAEMSTRLLRTHPDPMWAHLRELLPQRGVDPMADVLADLVQGGTGLEFGVVVTRARRVFEFTLSFGRDRDLEHGALAELSEWTEISDWWRATSHYAVVEDALELLLEE